MRYKITFAPEARDDLLELYRFIAERAGNDRAMGYVKRIETYCRGFSEYPGRGTRRDDLLPGLRIVGFERRITIAFHVGEGMVVFDRILYGGRDTSTLLEDT